MELWTTGSAVAHSSEVSCNCVQHSDPNSVQVSFHSAKQVLKVQNVRKDSDVVNRLNKTKRELYPDLAAERQAYDRAVSSQRKTEMQQKRSQDKADKEEAMRQADLQSYKHLMQVIVAGPCWLAECCSGTSAGCQAGWLWGSHICYGCRRTTWSHEVRLLRSPSKTTRRTLCETAHCYVTQPEACEAGSM